jgi:hypothetical protein
MRINPSTVMARTKLANGRKGKRDLLGGRGVHLGLEVAACETFAAGRTTGT